MKLTQPATTRWKISSSVGSGPPTQVHLREQHYFADHLGTSRVVTSATGVILDDSDFYPFGGEHAVVSSSGNNYKFTGKERDAESGLDEFEARYYSSALGRFASPDWSVVPAPVPYADLVNPQTLNLYAYVKNNPLNLIDPSGHLTRGAVSESEGMYIVPAFGANPLSRDGSDLAIYDTKLLTVNGETEEQQQPSPANAAKRNDIAATAESYDGSTAWANSATKDDFGPGNKCNKFVYDVTKEAGAEASVTGSDGKPRPPLAAEWANPNVKIANWRPLKPGEKPQPGDVAAYKLGDGRTPGATGHSGIVIADPKGGIRSISAHFDRVGPPNNQFSEAAQRGVEVVYRRYTGE